MLRVDFERTRTRLYYEVKLLSTPRRITPIYFSVVLPLGFHTPTVENSMVINTINFAELILCFK